MSSSSPLRADAARNRESLLAVASHAFATAETDPSLRAIAREAGVGIGTLHRPPATGHRPPVSCVPTSTPTTSSPA